jgi:VCBS repeat-containing protein
VPPVAQDDSLSTNEDTPLAGSVLVDNGNGSDLDADGDALTVTQVNGNGLNVGAQITLASGALLTLDANGSFDYDTNGQFEDLAVGASTTDSFTYTLSDGTQGTGAVHGVSFGAAGPVLDVGGVDVPLASVLAVTDGSRAGQSSGPSEGQSSSTPSDPTTSAV